VLHASLLLQPSVQLQDLHARLAVVTLTAEIPPTCDTCKSCMQVLQTAVVRTAAIKDLHATLACKFFLF